MTSVSTESESLSESGSSESSNLSTLPGSMDHHLMRPPSAYPGPLLNVQRATVEMQLIAQAADSLISCVDTYKHKMAASQTAYFYSEARTLAKQTIQKKTLRSLKTANLDRSLNTIMSDTASVVGSSVAAAPPYVGRYVSPVNQTLRAPSVCSEIPPFPSSHFPQPRQDLPNTAQTTSSGYSSELPSDSFCFKVDPMRKGRARQNNTLMQAISEVEDDEIEEIEVEEEPKSRSRNGSSRKKRNSNRQAREPEKVGKGSIPEARSRSSGEKKRRKSPQSSSDSDSDENEPSPPNSAKPKPKDKHGSSSSGQERKRRKSPFPDSDSDESDATSPPKLPKTIPKEKSKSKVLKLREWRLRVLGDDMVVAGYLSDRSKAVSGPIKRYSHPVIIAENGQYTVEGPPYIGTTAPNYLASYCKNGFPRQWKALTKKWIADTTAKEKKKATPRVQNRKDESKATNKGSSKQPREPRPSATSTPKSTENVKQSKETPPANKPRKRLSKSMDKSTASKPQGENQKKVVKPRHKSEARAEKKPREVRPPPVESESELSESASDSERESLAPEPPNAKKQTVKDTKMNEPKKKDLASRPKESKLKNKKAASKENSAVPNSEPSTSNQGVAEQRKAKARLFGDDSSGEDDEQFRIDPFANLGGDERISLGKLTPNGLMKSLEADQLHMGRHTPPMQKIQHLFDNSGSKSLASTGSPSSVLDTSRDNPVVKRMNKDLVEKKRKPKPIKKQPAFDTENRDPRMDEALNFLKPSNSNQNMRTPHIVKKVFRRQPSEDGTDLDEDFDESLAF